MSTPSFFKFREKVTPEIIELLSSVTLGTNGAHYQHLDITTRIQELDNPLFLTIERNNKALGNVTFCRREGHWYIRYFAFSPKVQSRGSIKSSSKKNTLKSEMSTIFLDIFNGVYSTSEVQSMYAYIDPKNERSIWMSEIFGFKQIATVATQTFSRYNPSKRRRVFQTQDYFLIEHLITQSFSKHTYFFTNQKPPFYFIKDEFGQILACAKISIANWRIRRLPGKYGGIMPKIIPFIPVINRIIKPKHHAFIVPEAVYIKDNNPNLLNELFEGILHHEKGHLIIWWVDQKDALYTEVRQKVRWGLLHKIIGVSPASVVVKENPNKSQLNLNNPIYTSGFDFI